MIEIYLTFIAITILGSSTLLFTLKKAELVRAFTISIIFTLYGLAFDFVGINILHWWDNTTSLLPELWNIPIGNIPFCIAGGTIFIGLWNKIDKPLFKAIFFFTATGTIAYGVSLAVFFGFLQHFPPYNIGWAYLFWNGTLGIMILINFGLNQLNPTTRFQHHYILVNTT
jgi:glucan phosphoethanolaminetransferase (alkaline phosphatase superfamily)